MDAKQQMKFLWRRHTAAWGLSASAVLTSKRIKLIFKMRHSPEQKVRFPQESSTFSKER